MRAPNSSAIWIPAVETALPPGTLTVGGTVSGLTGTGLVLRNNGGGDLSVSANGSFTFATAQESGTTYSVTVLTQPSGQICTANSNSGTVSSADVTSVTVTCSDIAHTYTIGGSISGLTASGLVLQNNGGNNLSVSGGATSFTFSTPVADNAGYSVTILTQPTGQNCTLSAPSGTVSGANVTSVAVTCTTVAGSFTIGGNVSGLSGGTLVLQNNVGDDLSITTNGNFTFGTPVPGGSTSNVTIKTQPAGQTCSVTSAFHVVTADVTNVTVTCSPLSYTIGGTITGLTASGLVLQNNGGNNLSVSGGATSFTFSTPIAHGTTYTVTVLTQPAGQSCTVNAPTNTGTVDAANVTDVSVNCSVNTYSIGGVNIYGAEGGPNATAMAAQRMDRCPRRR